MHKPVIKGKTSGSEAKEARYKWVVISLCFLMVCVVLGFCSSSKSLYILAITDALDVSRSAFSINDSCRYITTSVVNIFFGALIARFGEKRLIAAGFLCLIASCLLYSFAETMPVFYLGGIFLGAGLSWTTTTMVGYIVNKWCAESKGTIMGAVLAANGIGSAIAMQIISPMIYREGEPFGYRDAYRFVAILLLVVGVVILIFLRTKSHIPTYASAQRKKKTDRSWDGLSFREITKLPAFYAAIACIFCTGMVLQGITGVAAPHLSDVGLAPAFVAAAMSFHSVALSCSKFLTGVIYDKFAVRVTSNICILAAMISILLLAYVSDSFVGKAFAGIYSVLSSFALPLETVMLPIFAADLFGNRAYNNTLGIFASVNTAGYAVGTPITNLCYDLTGSYRTAFFAGCAIMAAVLFAMHFVIRTSERIKQNKIP